MAWRKGGNINFNIKTVDFSAVFILKLQKVYTNLLKNDNLFIGSCKRIQRKGEEIAQSFINKSRSLGEWLMQYVKFLCWG